MKTSTRSESNDPNAGGRLAQPGAVEGKAKTAVRCRLCSETILLESNFRPTAATCPHCGLKFVFDPQQEPLPVRGMKLRYAEVIAAQRRPGAVQHKRHTAHVPPVVRPPQPKPNYLAWAGGMALSLAAAMTLFGGWFHRILGR